jgi:hypothetical protein
MARGQRGLERGERQLQVRGDESYHGSLLTRDDTHTSNQVYEHVSFNFIHLIFIKCYI